MRSILTGWIALADCYGELVDPNYDRLFVELEADRSGAFLNTTVPKWTFVKTQFVEGFGLFTAPRGGGLITACPLAVPVTVAGETGWKARSWWRFWEKSDVAIEVTRKGDTVEFAVGAIKVFIGGDRRGNDLDRPVHRWAPAALPNARLQIDPP